MFGRKTTIEVSVPAVTAIPTCLAPRTAATLCLYPIRWCRWIFSVTTTALSTNIPIARIKPVMERMFIEIPIK